MKPHKSVLPLIAVCILTMFATPAFAGIIYVKASGTGGGTSWADAANLQNALTTLANSGDEIWVAAGTYKPTTTKDRTISFVMKAGVGIYGGFAGTESALADRDWVTNTTTLSGDIGAAGKTDNSYHVVTSNGLDSAAVLDGFIISGGNADGPNNYGGGMYNNNSNPTVANCIFSDNSTMCGGGGMYNNSSSPTITNCAFSGNKASKEGGGMRNYRSSLIINNCAFSGNKTSQDGGGIYNFICTPIITNCTFSGNTATKEGGGMSSNGGSGSNLTITNCTFSGNTASFGGGLDNGATDMTIINCTFSGNTATACGGGMCNGSTSNNLTITNCTFSGNNADSSGGGIYNFGSNPVVTNCILWNNLPDEILWGSPVITYSIVEGGFTGTGNLDTDPLFVDPASGNYRLQGTSPAIDAGSDIAIPSGITTDLDGNLRITGAAVDIGAYELAPEINVKQGTTNIASAGSYDFGNVAVGSDSGAITFTIENTGTADLSLSGTPKITLSGTDAADFSVDETLTTSPVAASRMTTFTVTLTPSSDVAKTAILTIANDDSDEGTYTITLNGTGTVAPEINVKQGTTNIAYAGSYNFGSVTVGGDSGAITFTIENKGSADLSLSGTPKIAISGTNAADFSVDETSTSSPVAASGSTTFIVTFTPSSVAAETATISIANDDSDENPYTVTLTGTGTDGTTIPPVIPGPPLPIVITAEVSDITATGATSGGNVVYPEGCTALLLARGVAWDTVSPPTYPQDSHTFDGWAAGEYASSLTNLVPQTEYYIRAYVQYKLNGVVYTRYSEYIYNFTTPALPGDVNGDKILDLKDAILALKIVADAAGNAAINLPADVNEDGKIGVEEAVYVLQNVGSAE